MTELMTQAVAKVATMPANLQDAIAARFLEEVADEQRWQVLFDRDPTLLDEWAAEAREEVRTGKAVEMGWDEL